MGETVDVLRVRILDPAFAGANEAHVEERSVTLRQNRGRFALSAGEEPVNWSSDVLFSDLTHNSGDRLAGFIEDDRARDDVAEPKAVERVRVGADPTREINVKSSEGDWNFGPVLRCID